MGDGLAPSPEPDTIWAVHGKVTEKRTLPSTKTLTGNRHRQRYIHSDHTHFNIIGEVPCRLTVAGENTGAVTVLMVIDQVHGLLLGLDPDYAEYWSEDFIFIYFHFRRNMIEQATAQEKTVFIPFNHRVTAIDYKSGTLFHTQVDIPFDFLKMGFVDQGSHIVVVVTAWSDFHHRQLDL